ncbi:MAG: putative rane protein [Anaerocolumna sp.]|jgi:hypothetical protein|nr:putative rane protein [Anaerocolumna sp.]
MSEFQKVLKYFAIAFAIFLAVTIIGGMITGILALAGIFTGGSSVKTIDLNQSFENVKSITIEHGIGNLTVKEGDSDKVEVIGENVSENIVAEKNFSGNLSIRYKSSFFHWFNVNSLDGNNTRLTVYLPKGFIAENIEISAGAGNVSLENIKTENFEMDGGAGNINGENMVAGKVKIDGGVGEISLEEIDFTDANIDSGVGNIYLEGYLSGKNKINCGVGEVDLKLKGSIDDYNIEVEKGLGNIYINGDKYSDVNWNNMTAPNELDIDGGVGNIRIDFE